MPLRVALNVSKAAGVSVGGAGAPEGDGRIAAVLDETIGLPRGTVLVPNGQSSREIAGAATSTGLYSALKSCDALVTCR